MRVDREVTVKERSVRSFYQNAAPLVICRACHWLGRPARTGTFVVFWYGRKLKLTNGDEKINAKIKTEVVLFSTKRSTSHRFG